MCVGNGTYDFVSIPNYTTTLFLCSVQSLIYADIVTPHITLNFFHTFYTMSFRILLSTSSIALIAHQTFSKSIRLSLCSKKELILWPYHSYRHLDILIRTLVSYPTCKYVKIIDRQSSAHIHNSFVFTSFWSFEVGCIKSRIEHESQSPKFGDISKWELWVWEYLTDLCLNQGTESCIRRRVI